MKQIWKWIIVVPIVVGIIVAVMITIKNQSLKLDEKNKIKNIFNSVATKPAKITKFYTYGKSFNIEGKIDNISEDNFEGIKVVLRDGKDFEKSYKLSYSFDKENGFTFSTGDVINKAIILDNLPVRKILCSNQSKN